MTAEDRMIKMRVIKNYKQVYETDVYRAPRKNDLVDLPGESKRFRVDLVVWLYALASDGTVITVYVSSVP